MNVQERLDQLEQGMEKMQQTYEKLEQEKARNCRRQCCSKSAQSPSSKRCWRMSSRLTNRKFWQANRQHDRTSRNAGPLSISRWDD